MNTYEVWHANAVYDDTTGRFTSIKGMFGMAPTVFPDDYTHVADVQADTLDQVFQLTNHIDLPWWKNDGVTIKIGQASRSTSIQDVVKVGNQLFVVAPVGYAQYVLHGTRRILPAMYGSGEGM